MATLMPDQKYPGGYIQPRANTFIIVVRFNGVERVALWSATSMTGSGDAVRYSYSLEVPVDYNSDTQQFVNVPILVPIGTTYRVDTYSNNVENNKKYARYEKANFVSGTQEYVPDIRNGYVDIIKALYKDQSVEGLSAENITPEVVAIVDTMLDEIQDGSKAMVGVDIVFQLFYGITNWSGFIRNAKGVDYSDTVDWLNVLRGNSNYTTIVNYTAAQYKNPLQIALLTAKK